VALLEYPLSSRCALTVAVLADGPALYLYRGVSAHEAAKARQFLDWIREE
jgi:hypothetical protein